MCITTDVNTHTQTQYSPPTIIPNQTHKIFHRVNFQLFLWLYVGVGSYVCKSTVFYVSSISLIFSWYETYIVDGYLCTTRITYLRHILFFFCYFVQSTLTSSYIHVIERVNIKRFCSNPIHLLEHLLRFDISGLSQVQIIVLLIIDTKYIY